MFGPCLPGFVRNQILIGAVLPPPPNEAPGRQNGTQMVPKWGPNAVQCCLRLLGPGGETVHVIRSMLFASPWTRRGKRTRNSFNVFVCPSLGDREGKLKVRSGALRPPRPPPWSHLLGPPVWRALTRIDAHLRASTRPLIPFT